MQMLLDVIKFIAAHFNEIVTALVGLLMGIIGVCLIIPGDFPDKQLQAMVDFLKKFSAK